MVIPAEDMTPPPDPPFVHVPASGSQKADQTADQPIQSVIPILTGDSGGSVTVEYPPSQ